MLLAGIRESAASGVPERVFFAHMIAEMGKRSPVPYNILDADVDPATIRLDPIQREMILMRLAGDLHVAERDRQTAERRTGTFRFCECSVSRAGLPASEG